MPIHTPSAKLVVPDRLTERPWHYSLRRRCLESQTGQKDMTILYNTILYYAILTSIWSLLLYVQLGYSISKRIQKSHKLVMSEIVWVCCKGMKSGSTWLNSRWSLQISHSQPANHCLRSGPRWRAVLDVTHVPTHGHSCTTPYWALGHEENMLLYKPCLVMLDDAWCLFAHRARSCKT